VGEPAAKITVAAHSGIIASEAVVAVSKAGISSHVAVSVVFSESGRREGEECRRGRGDQELMHGRSFALLPKQRYPCPLSQPRRLSLIRLFSRED
jgi:hypothetical protein